MANKQDVAQAMMLGFSVGLLEGSRDVIASIARAASEDANIELAVAAVAIEVVDSLREARELMPNYDELAKGMSAMTDTFIERSKHASISSDGGDPSPDSD